MSNHQQLIYWRRRLLALILGLTALGLVTWAISGAIGPAGSARPDGARDWGWVCTSCPKSSRRTMEMSK